MKLCKLINKLSEEWDIILGQTCLLSAFGIVSYSRRTLLTSSNIILFSKSSMTLVSLKPIWMSSFTVFPYCLFYNHLSPRILPFTSPTPTQKKVAVSNIIDSCVCLRKITWIFRRCIKFKVGGYYVFQISYKSSEVLFLVSGLIISSLGIQNYYRFQISYKSSDFLLLVSRITRTVLYWHHLNHGWNFLSQFLILLFLHTWTRTIMTFLNIECVSSKDLWQCGWLFIFFFWLSFHLSAPQLLVIHCIS